MVPLIGHTLGHCGVVLDGERPIFYAADAYFYHAEMNVERPRCTPGLRMYQWMMEKNRRARLWNQRRLRELERQSGDAVELFCAHDTVEFDRLAGRSFATPAQYGASPIAGAGHAADIRHST
jgi:glyoxylase-like metal-dependent hydrolase (beta-lactamase superfamily II)